MKHFICLTAFMIIIVSFTTVSGQKRTKNLNFYIFSMALFFWLTLPLDLELGVNHHMQRKCCDLLQLRLAKWLNKENP